jgi:hypothetical protein
VPVADLAELAEPDLASPGKVGESGCLRVDDVDDLPLSVAVEPDELD